MATPSFRTPCQPCHATEVVSIRCSDAVPLSAFTSLGKPTPRRRIEVSGAREFSTRAVGEPASLAVGTTALALFLSPTIEA